MIFLISTIIVAAILTVLSIFPLHKKPEKYPGFEKTLKKIAKGKVKNGQTVEGYGEFGLSASNPIPANTTFGSYRYLDQLKTIDGQDTKYKRLGSILVPNIPFIVDQYSVWSDNIEPVTIYICPYYNKTSGKAPVGFWVAKQQKVFRIIKTPAEIVEFMVVLILNLIIISVITLLFKQFNTFYLLLISLINATWMYFILMPFLGRIRRSSN